jgi:hypothetical protein
MPQTYSVTCIHKVGRKLCGRKIGGVRIRGVRHDFSEHERTAHPNAKFRQDTRLGHVGKFVGEAE